MRESDAVRYATDNTATIWRRHQTSSTWMMLYW